MERTDRIAGVILGTAVGDALGLPREGLSRRRANKIFGGPPLRYRFLLRHGMVSDDTEHTCMVGQALLRAPENADLFGRSLAWRLRFWLLGLPAAVGRATATAIVKLWLGFPPRISGVYSGGNGPVMRAALLGVCLGSNPERLRTYIRASTRLTHTDPRAERGALLVALAAHWAAGREPSKLSPSDVLTRLKEALGKSDTELDELLAKMKHHLDRDAMPDEFADALGLKKGISGYVYHTVPMAIYCWLRWPNDFRQAVESVIALGGDTDSTGAIVGGLAGATVGEKGIPVEWVEGLWEWPRSVKWMRELAARLAQRFAEPANVQTCSPVPLFWPGLFLRNLAFLVIVLIHGFRRLLPPY